MKWLLSLLILIPALSGAAAIGEYDRQFSDPELSERYDVLTNQLRCPKCQNNNVADSNAPIAQDIRARVYDLLLEGQDNQQIIDYMIDRYGRFVTYKPPLTLSTLIIWAIAPLSILAGIGAYVAYVRRRQRDTVALLNEAEQAKFYQLLEEV